MAGNGGLPLRMHVGSDTRSHNVVSLLDMWPEVYRQEPYRSYARILDEQPDPPRRVTYLDVLKAQFRSRVMLGIMGLGAVSSVIYSVLIVREHNAVLTLSTIVLLLGPAVFLVFYPFFDSWRMARALRDGMRTEAHLVGTREGPLARFRGSGGDLQAKVRFGLGGQVVEREGPMGLQRKWLKDVSPEDVIEVLVDPKSGVPRLFLRVKHRASPAVVGESSKGYAPGSSQPEEPAEMPTGRRGCLGGGCLNYVFMLGLFITMSLFAVAIIGIIFVLFKPGGTAEGRQAVLSMSLWLLLAGLGAALLFVVPFIILAIVAQRKR
ncbi:MAG: hypothetical protein ACJ78Q_20625 [Chloroflexia bacterium]